MSKTSVSEDRNRFPDNFTYRKSNDMTSNTHTSKSSSAEATQASNCVINIDYVVQEEKISFEVFRASLDHTCIFRKKFSLRKSKSCTQVSSAEKQKPLFVPYKMVQTEPKELVARIPVPRGLTPVLAPANLGPPPFFRIMQNEFPVKDVPNAADYNYKENYDVSSFKFPDSTNVVPSQNSNFCCLDFDGTKSYKKNYNLHRTKNKHSISAKPAKSDLNINKFEKEEKYAPLVYSSKVDPTLCDINKFPGLKKELTVEKIQEHRSKKKKHSVTENASDTNTVKLAKQDHVAFEFVLRPKDETPRREKSERRKHRPRKIIVTSNTLQPSIRPHMKNAQQQTVLSDFIKDGGTSVNELYKRPDFKPTSLDNNTLNSGDVIYINKKRKKKKMTMSVFPCVEIKSSFGKEQHIELPTEIPLCKERPSIPRRKIDNSGILESDLQSSRSYDDDTMSTISRIPRGPTSTTSGKTEQIQLKEKITTLFNEHSQCLDYGRKIDELCSLITCLVKERSRSRSRSKSPLKANSSSPASSTRENSFKKESGESSPRKEIPVVPKEKSKPKLDRLKITHNEKDTVSILETIEENVKQNQNQNQTQSHTQSQILKCCPTLSAISRDVLKISPRANELIKISEFKRKNSIATYPGSMIMPDKKVEQSIVESIATAPISCKSKTSKKSTDTKRNCSSVTFNSQIAIIGNESHMFNTDDINVKNTLFQVNEKVFKRSRTLPSKQDFSKGKEVSITASKGSLVTSTYNNDIISSHSNSELSSNSECKKKEPKKNCPANRPRTPGAIENSTFLSIKKPVNKINSFQKRKEYYNTLKLTQKNKSSTKDFRKKSDVASLSSRRSSRDPVIPEETSENLSNHTIITNQNTSKSKIPCLKQQPSKKEVASKQFNIKPAEEIVMVHTIEPYGKSSKIGSFLHTYPLEKSAEKVDKNEQGITFIQSYPLENSTANNTANNSIAADSMKNNASFSIPETLQTSFESVNTEGSYSKLDFESLSKLDGSSSSKFNRSKTNSSLKSEDKPVKLLKKITKIKIKKYPSYLPKKKISNIVSKLSDKTVSLYKSPCSFTKTDTEYSYLSLLEEEYRLSYKSRQMNENNQQFVYYSTKPTTTCYERQQEQQQQKRKDCDCCELGNICKHFCCLKKHQCSSEFNVKKESKKEAPCAPPPKLVKKKKECNRCNTLKSPCVQVQKVSVQTTMSNAPRISKERPSTPSKIARLTKEQPTIDHQKHEIKPVQIVNNKFENLAGNARSRSPAGASLKPIPTPPKFEMYNKFNIPKEKPADNKNKIDKKKIQNHTLERQYDFLAKNTQNVNTALIETKLGPWPYKKTPITPIIPDKKDNERYFVNNLMFPVKVKFEGSGIKYKSGENPLSKINMFSNSSVADKGIMNSNMDSSITLPKKKKLTHSTSTVTNNGNIQPDLDSLMLLPKKDITTMVSITTFPTYNNKKTNIDSIMLLPRDDVKVLKENKRISGSSKASEDSKRDNQCQTHKVQQKRPIGTLKVIEEKPTLLKPQEPKHTIKENDSISQLYLTKETKAKSSELFGLIDEKLKRQHEKSSKKPKIINSFINTCKRKNSVSECFSTSAHVPDITNSTLTQCSSQKYLKLFKIDAVASFIRRKTIAVRRMFHQYKHK